MQYFEGNLPSQLSTLPSEARQELAHLLLSGDEKIEISAALAKELHARDIAIDSGEEPLLSVDTLVSELRNKYT